MLKEMLRCALFDLVVVSDGISSAHKQQSVTILPPLHFTVVFDNVDIDDIAKIALAWEQKWGFIRGGDIAARERRWKMGNSLSVLSSERIGELAKELVDKARENSLDRVVDSPFALLAKDNDIMWSGGETTHCFLNDTFGTSYNITVPNNVSLLHFPPST